MSLTGFNAVEAVRGFVGKYDLRDAGCKSLCDKLTGETWSCLAGGYTKYDLEELVCVINKTIHFPHISSRLKDLYFLTAFHRFSCDPEALRVWIGQERHYSGFLFCKSKMIYSALLDMDGGDRAAGAFKILKATQEYFSGNITTPFLSYCRSVASVVCERGWNLEVILGSPSSRGAVFVAADLLYVRRFLKRYIDSMVSRLDVDGVDFILCLIVSEGELSSEDVSFLDKIGKSYDKGRFVLELKNKPDYGDIRTYYACSRFMLAGNYLERYDYLVITDMDYEIKEGASYSAFLDGLESYSLGVNKKEQGLGSFFPWLKYTAGTVYVRNDSLGIEFLNKFKWVFDNNYNGNCFNWGLDQNILYSLLEGLSMGKLADRFINIKAIGEPFTVPYDIKQ